MTSSLRRLAATARRFALPLLAAGLLSPTAQAQDSTLTRLVRQYSLPLTQHETEFSGAGWDKLRKDIQQSPLVLVGEDHGMAQIPVFTTAIARELKPELYVAEFDKYQAEEVTRRSAQPGLPTAFHQQHPMGLSFYSWAEEYELARYLRSQQVPLIGVEQVTMMTTGYLFERMAAAARNKHTKAYLQQRAAAYQAHDNAVMRTGKGQFSIYQRAAALDSLRQLTAKESPAVQQMAADFALSAQIYQLNNAGDPRSHQTRVNLMKRNVLAALQPYQQRPALPRTLFKFGAMHVARGASFIGGVYDVGNLVSNLADAHDQKSLHVFVIGMEGTQVGGFNPDDFSKNIHSYTNADNAILKPFFAPQTGGAWQVLDLRPLRRALLRNRLNVSSQSTQTMIMGYDYLVLIPQTTASHNF